MRRQELIDIKNAPKKLDEIFGIIRSESVDEFRTDIKIRGMGNVKLKAQSTRQSTFDHNKLEEQMEKKKIAQRQIAMPEKPATYKKPKPKPQIEDKPISPEPLQKEPSPELTIIEESEQMEVDVLPVSPGPDNNIESAIEAKIEPEPFSCVRKENDLNCQYF